MKNYKELDICCFDNINMINCYSNFICLNRFIFGYFLFKGGCFYISFNLMCIYGVFLLYVRFCYVL